MAFSPISTVPLDDEEEGRITGNFTPISNQPIEPSSLARRAADIPVGLAKGLVAAPQGVYGLADVLTGGYLDRATGAVAKALYGPDALSAGQGLKAIQDKIGEYYTPETQDALKFAHETAQRYAKAGDEMAGLPGDIAGGFVGSLAAMAQRPSSALPIITESLPSMLVPAKVTGVVAENVAARAAAKFADPMSAAAQKAAAEAVEAFVKSKAGIATASAAEGVFAGGQNAAQQKAELLALPEEEWQKRSQPYRDLLAQGVDPAEAKLQIANSAALRTALVSGALSTAAGPISGGLEARFGARVFGGAAGKGVDVAGQGSRTLGALKTGAIESAQEIPQSGGEQFGQNVGMRAFDPSQNLAEDVGEQAGMGAVAGFGMGGGMGLASRARLAPVQTDPQPATADPEQPTLALPPPVYPLDDRTGDIPNEEQRNQVTSLQARAQALYAARDAEEKRQQALKEQTAQALEQSGPIGNIAAAAVRNDAVLGVPTPPAAEADLDQQEENPPSPYLGTPMPPPVDRQGDRIRADQEEQQMLADRQAQQAQQKQAQERAAWTGQLAQEADIAEGIAAVEAGNPPQQGAIALALRAAGATPQRFAPLGTPTRPAAEPDLDQQPLVPRRNLGVPTRPADQPAFAPQETTNARQVDGTTPLGQLPGGQKGTGSEGRGGVERQQRGAEAPGLRQPGQGLAGRAGAQAEVADPLAGVRAATNRQEYVDGVRRVGEALSDGDQLYDPDTDTTLTVRKRTSKNGTDVIEFESGGNGENSFNFQRKLGQTNWKLSGEGILPPNVEVRRQRPATAPTATPATSIAPAVTESAQPAAAQAAQRPISRDDVVALRERMQGRLAAATSESDRASIASAINNESRIIDLMDQGASYGDAYTQVHGSTPSADFNSLLSNIASGIRDSQIVGGGRTLAQARAEARQAQQPATTPASAPQAAPAIQTPTPPVAPATASPVQPDGTLQPPETNLGPTSTQAQQSQAQGPERQQTPNTGTAPADWNERVNALATRWNQSDRGQRSYIAMQAGLGTTTLGSKKTTLATLSWEEIPMNLRRELVKAGLRRSAAAAGPAPVDAAAGATLPAGWTIRQAEPGTLTAGQYQVVDDRGQARSAWRGTAAEAVAEGVPADAPKQKQARDSAARLAAALARYPKRDIARLMSRIGDEVAPGEYLIRRGIKTEATAKDLARTIGGASIVSADDNRFALVVPSRQAVDAAGAIGHENTRKLKRAFKQFGIVLSERPDITGERGRGLRGTGALPGTFRADGMGIDEWGQRLVDEGFLEPESASEVGNENIRASMEDVRDFIRTVLAGEPVWTVDQASDKSAWLEAQSEAMGGELSPLELADLMDSGLTQDENIGDFDAAKFLIDAGLSEQQVKAILQRADETASFDEDYEQSIRRLAGEAQAAVGARPEGVSGANGEARPGLELASQSEADLAARDAEIAAAQAKADAEAAAAEAKAKRERAAKETSERTERVRRERADEARDTFELGQEPPPKKVTTDEAAGQGDLLAGTTNATTEPPTAQRFEIGRSLTKEQKSKVLETLVDVYRAKGAEKVSKGLDRDGNDIIGYAYSPDLFEKSDVTGAMIRYYVTLPDGKIAHPSELFPEWDQSKIDAELQAQRYREQQAEAERKDRVKALDARKADDINEANRAFWKQQKGTQIKPEETVLATDGKQFVRLYKPRAEADLKLLGDGWSIKPVGELLASTEQVPDANTEDSGEELAYNKRNRVRTGIKWSDIADKDIALRVKETTKANVYPRPDYEGMIADGMEPLFAHIVKQAYDALAAKPITNGAPTDEQLKLYIEGVNRYMSGVLAWANNPAQVRSWLGGIARVASANIAAMRGQTTALSALTEKREKSLLDTVYPGGWKDHRAELTLIGGNKAYGALQPSTDDAVKAMKEIDKGWPGKQEAWQRQGYTIAKGDDIAVEYWESEGNPSNQPFVVGYAKAKVGRDSKQITSTRIDGASTQSDPRVQEWERGLREKYDGKFLVLDKRGKVKGAADTVEKATDIARDLTKREGKTTVKDEGIKVTEAERIGVERRLPGEDVSSDKLKETFGFRGVNFGNWMKGDANLKERQLHLNHAYDALMDLADIFGVEPRAISLNGLLGIAIGAQGNGTAAAHFMPGLNEINLTRTSGAGSLAHEWAHALDHHFARQSGLTRETEPFLTEHANLGPMSRRMELVDGKYVTVDRPRFDGVRPEILAAFKTIVQAMRKRKLTPEEMATRRDLSRQGAKRGVERWLAAIRRDFDGAKADPGVLSKFDTLATKVQALDLGDGHVSIGRSTFIAPRVSEIRDLYKQATGRTYSIDNIKGLQSNVDHLKYIMEAKEDAKTHEPQMVSSNYSAAAAALDRDKGGKRYWSTDLEMFARAFDAFVSDTLEAKAAKNTYLSHAGRMDETTPQGDERTAINEAIKTLVDTIESRETDKGVELYSESSAAANPQDDAIRAARTAADVYAAMREAGGFYAELADRLEALGVDPAIAHGEPGTVIRDGIAYQKNAAWNPATDTATFYAREGLVQHAAHEFTHSATYDAIERNTPAGQAMRTLYNAVVRSGKIAEGTYGLKDVHEFVAEAHSNPAFQAALEGIKNPLPQGKLKTAWDAFVDIVRRVVGLPAIRRDALAQALRVGNDLMQESAQIRNQEGAELESVTRQASDITTLDRLQRLIREGVGGRPVYLRFARDIDGDLRGRRSTNWVSGERESGLSVVPLSDDGMAGYVPADEKAPAESAQNIGAQVGNYVDYLDFRGATGGYLVTGEVQGYGSDGEPLLKNATLVGRVDPEVLFGAYQAWADSTGDAGLSRRVAARIDELRSLGSGTKRPRLTINDLVAATLEAGDWHDWYDRHQAELESLFGDDAGLFQKFLAATSQATSVPSNVTLALKAYRQHLRGEPFTGFLPSVIKNLDRAVRDVALAGNKISEYEMATGGEDGVAVDRHIAELIFNTQRPSLLQVRQAQRMIRTVAAELGLDAKHVQAALWAYNQIRKGAEPQSYDTYLRAKADEIAALRAAHGRGQGAGVQGRRAAGGRGAGEAGNRGRNARGAGSGGEELYSLTGGQPRAAQLGSWQYEGSKLDPLTYTLTDKNIDTVRVQQAIEKVKGQLTEDVDVRLKETLFAGKADKATKDFLTDEVTPLLNEMRARKVSQADLEEYLHNRHAPERNAQIARVNPQMPDGGSGIDTADAQAYMAGLTPAKRAALQAVARKVDAIIAGTRQALVNYGLESQDTVNKWAATYPTGYVPLFRAEMPEAMGIGQGFSVNGSASKRAMGSTLPVENILANIVLQREKAITRGEKTPIARALFGLAIQNPNPEFWDVTPPTMRYIDPQTGQVESMVDPRYKNADNVVIARMPDGQGNIVERAVVFNESNPQAMRMAEAIKNLDMDQLGTVLGSVAKVTRLFSALQTQYNPVFGVVNLTRDVQTAMLNLSSTPIAGKQDKVLKYTLSALKGVYQDMRAIRAGRHANSRWAGYFEDFAKQGGKTGFRDMYRTSEDRAKALEHELNPNAWMDSPLGKFFTANGVLKVPYEVAADGARGLFGWLSDYNEAMENAVRVAAYRTAVESGMSKPRAAALAKELTVNFNRKGQIATQAGALYAFYNASAQGTVRLAKTLAGPAGKKIVLGGLTLGALQAFALAAAGFDDDEPPEFVRERSLIIPLANKKYLTIPMPLGFHVIPNISRITTEWAMSGGKDTGKRVASLFGVFADSFNPIGSSTFLQTITPTVVDPVAALAENKDWTGKPIYKPDQSGTNPTPGHTRAKDSASHVGKMISLALNTLSGGDKYTAGMLSPTPDQIDYLIGQATGGVGREVLKVSQTANAALTGEDLPTYKVPLVGRFYGDADQQASQSAKFYENITKLNVHEQNIKGRQKDREPIAEYLAENPEARLWVLGNQAERQIQQLNKRKRELIAQDAPKEEIKRIDDLMTQRMRMLNERVRAAQQ